MENFEAINALSFCDLAGIDEGPARKLVLTLHEAPASDFEEDSPMVAPPPADAEPPRVLRVTFEDYVAYAVRNESFAINDPYETFDGAIARIYRQSRFIDFVRATTLDHADFPGPFSHYGFLCVEHVIDVAAGAAPTVELVDPG